MSRHLTGDEFHMCQHVRRLLRTFVCAVFIYRTNDVSVSRTLIQCCAKHDRAKLNTDHVVNRALVISEINCLKEERREAKGGKQ